MSHRSDEYLTPEQVPPGEAAEEVLRRRAARRSLLRLRTTTWPGYIVERAHELMGRALDDVVAGTCKRLMIWAPPQIGKSELVSIALPARWLGERPDEPVLLTSYAAALAHAKSRRARQLVEDEEFGALYPHVRTSRESRAVDQWELAAPHRGQVRAAGVGGGITGHPASLGIIDDPHENWEAAQSETQREKVWEWYLTTFLTRVRDGAVVLIMTRWHQDDLAGRILRSEAAAWRVLRIPALAETPEERLANDRYLFGPQAPPAPDPLGREPGASAAPRRYSSAHLRRTRQRLGALMFGCLYQGCPRPAEGNRIKRRWFTLVDAVPPAEAEVAVWVRAWDKAATEGAGDYTVGALLAMSDEAVYVVDVVRGRWSSGARERIIADTAAADKALRGWRLITILEQEPGSSGKDSAEASLRALRAYRAEARRSTGAKDVRGEPFAAAAEGGQVRLVRGPWNDAWLEEVCGFPNATHDDQWDATTLAYNRAAEEPGDTGVTFGAQVARRRYDERQAALKGAGGGPETTEVP